MKIDIAKLTATTKEAIKIGEEAARAKIEHEKRMEDEKRQVEEHKAESILLQIPARAEQEAKVGRNHATVMSIGYGDYHGNTYKNTLDPNILIGAAKIVYDSVAKAGLAPTLEFWHDGVGMNSGYNIVIHWPK